jgi:hypothetical protein
VKAMLDQLIIGDKGSCDDFEASVKERVIHPPKKKSIKKTIPFSNVTHDFSAINGEVYWEERTLEYIFEIIANSAEELEEKKQPFISWIMNVMNAKLYDPFIPDYHFLATYEDMSVDDSEIEKATITVTFKAYPYMIANFERKYTEKIEPESSATVRIYNDSSHKITPTILVAGSVRIVFGNISVALGRGVHKNVFTLEPGLNELHMENLEKTNDTDLPEIERIAIELGYTTVEITFIEEVF